MNTAQPVKDGSMIDTNPLISPLVSSKLQLAHNTNWKTVEVNGEDVEIPQEWEVQNLGNIFQITGGGTPPTGIAEYWGGNIPWVGPKFMGYDRRFVDVNHPDSKRLTEAGAKKVSDKATPAGSLIVSSRAPVGYANIAPCDLYTNQGCYSFMDIGEGSPIFMFFWIRKNTNLLESRSSGTTFLEISRKNISLLECPLPTYDNQTLIAQTLTAQEDHIASLKQQSSIQRKRLDWLTDELLSGRIRVEEDLNSQPTVLKRDEQGNVVDSLPAVKLVANTDWKTVEVNGEDVEIPQEWAFDELDNHASFKKGKGLSKKDLDGGSNQCIHYGKLFTSYHNEILEIKNSTSISKNKMVLSKKYDVLMPTSDVTPRGLATASCILKEDVILGGDILVITPHCNLFGPYLSRLVRTQKDQIMKLVTGSTVYHIYAKDMGKFTFKMPPILEQTLIAQTLTAQEEYIASLDQMIAIEEKRLTWLTDELLSGRILIEEVK